MDIISSIKLAELFLALLFSVWFMLNALGWGVLITNLSRLETHLPFSVTTLIGMAGIVWLVSLLNLLGLAQGVVSSILLSLGLLFLGLNYGSREKIKRLFQDLSEQNWWMISFILLISLFMMATTVPSSIFNFHDDFHTYFVAPLRLVESGSLFMAGDITGPSTISSQGLLQGYIWFWLDVRYLNLLELFICFLLALLVLDSLGQHFQASMPLRLTAVILVLVIHPQYVNVAAIYSSSALVLAIIYLLFIYGEYLESNHTREQWVIFVPLALLFSLFLSLKGTNLPFALLLLALAPFLIMQEIQAKIAATRAMILLLLTGVFILPWLLMPESAYGDLIRHAFSSMGNVLGASGDSSQDGSDRLGLLQKTAILFSFRELFWGASFHAYNSLILLIWISVITWFVVNRLHKGREDTSRSYSLSIKTIFIFAIIITTGYFSGLILYGQRPDLIIRYSIPVVLAASPAIMLLCGAGLRHSDTDHKHINRFAPALLLVFSFISILLFFPTFAERIQKQVEHHTLLSFDVAYNETYQGYMKYAQGEQNQRRLRDAQISSEKGKKILAWTATPFHLDFSRNPIAIMDGPGVGPFYNKIAKASDPVEALKKELCSRKISYVIMQYGGYGMRFNRGADSQLKKIMLEMIEQEHVKFNNADVLTFSMPACS